jgi:serine/threonine protein kinase
MDDWDAKTEALDPSMLRARARIGRVLDGKWHLDVLLGMGGMASVYAATHRNGTRAAIKLLHGELAANHEVRARFLREGYVANSVGHDGAVRVLDDDVDEDGTPFLVTELLDGETVEERRVRAGGALPEEDVLCIVDHLLDVLVAAHERGIVHRDLKPENVFLTRDGRVKVLDFGIARLRASSSASTATRTGAAMGTPAFMPPEQARGLWDEVDARSDLWAVGALMFHVLSGALPHQGRTPNEQLLSAMSRPVPSLASVAPQAGPAIANLVDRALAFAREKRWPDARRMQDILRRAYHDRFNVPITTAPNLSVPASVPNRTLGGSHVAPTAPRLPTTGQPVETVRTALSVRGLMARNRVAVLLLGGAASVGLAVAAAAWIVSATRTGVGTTATSAPSDAPLPAAVAASESLAMAAAASSAPPAPPPPVLSTMDLPSPPTVATGATPRATSAAAQPPTTPPARAIGSSVIPANPYSCSPPFTIDGVTRAKHFKAECL